MRKKRIFSFLIIYMSAVFAAGCQGKAETEEVAAAAETEEENMFGLTQAEQKIYAEYAAGVLMKYNAGTNMRVMEGQRLVQAEEAQQAEKEKEEKREQLAEAYQNGKENISDKESGQTSGLASNGSNTGDQTVSDVAAAVGMDIFSVRYTGYELTDSYPHNGEDLYFAMDATSGKKLLVLKFEVTNNSDQVGNFDMFSKQAKFKVKVNEKTYKSQYTLLLNDLSMYSGELEPAALAETVLIFEIPEEVEVIDAMELSITASDKNSKMLLIGNYSEPAEKETEEAVAETAEEAIENDAEEPEEEEGIIRDNSNLASEYMEALEAEENLDTEEESE